ncbi:MAG: amidohydrolase family protein, partial [Candidatus Wallbacteria bacterium]|nr:amidohydrolase family protein [Candidatus Wallbacteria bacterium]
MDLIVRNGTIITGDQLFQGDIGVRNGKIVAVGEVSGTAAQEIDAEGMLVFPGLIDPHVHFKLPVRDVFSSDDFMTGSRAALLGGITTYLDFTNQPLGKPLAGSLRERLDEVKENSYSDFGLHALINDWPAGYENEIEHMISSGVTSFKFFMYSRGQGEKCDDGTLYRLLRACGERALVILHAENGSLINHFTEEQVSSGRLDVVGHALARPAMVEEEAVERAVFWAGKSGGMIMILHLSTAGAASIIKKARQRGIKVMAETCPQYLVLDESMYGKENAYLHATCPPVRTASDREGLWDAIAGGD